MSLGVMTPNHPRWPEFGARLAGPEACDFRDGPDGSMTWNCSGQTRDQAAAILRDMGANDRELLATLDYFSDHGGYCDCEIVFNIDALLYDGEEV